MFIGRKRPNNNWVKLNCVGAHKSNGDTIGVWRDSSQFIW